MLGIYSVLCFLTPADLPQSIRGVAAGMTTLFSYAGSGCSGIYFSLALSDTTENPSDQFDPWILSLSLATIGMILFSEFARRARNTAVLHRKHSTVNLSAADISTNVI